VEIQARQLHGQFFVGWKSARGAGPNHDSDHRRSIVHIHPFK